MIVNDHTITLYTLLRKNKPEKEFIDALNIQISRMLKRTGINDLSNSQTRILYLLVSNCTSSYFNYIKNKHCK